jgi:integrase
MLTKTERLEQKKRKKPGLYGDGRLYKRGRIWWFRCVKDGETIDQSTGKHIQAEAIQERDRIKATLKNDVPALQKLVTVNTLIDDYFAHLDSEGRKSRESIKLVVNANIRRVFGDRVAATITSDDIKAYRTKRTEEENKPATINNELAYMRSAYYVGKDRQTPPKVLAIPYFTMVKPNNVRTGFIDVAGYLTILSELPNSLKPLFAGGFHWGCRVGELESITWPQVDLDDEFIALESGATKNGEGRGLPIYGEMKKWLTEQKEIRDRDFPESSWVFFWHKDAWQSSHLIESKPGDQVRDFEKTWKAAVKRAGYDGLLFHDLRRSAIRNMRKAKISTPGIMKISGHKTISTFLRYDIIDRADVKETGKTMDKWMTQEKANATS